MSDPEEIFDELEISENEFWQRVRRVITESVGQLTPDDYRRRVEHCASTGAHGVSMRPRGDEIIFTWGGDVLARVPREAFWRRGVLALIPDTIPPDWAPEL